MSSEQAYIEGFVKRASEYGYSEADALDALEKLADYSTNNDINTSIQAQNANFGKPSGSMGIVDFPIKGAPSQRRPVYNPTNPDPSYPKAALTSNIPVLGNIAGPIARAATGDFLGAGINAASTAMLGLGPLGIGPSKFIEYGNDALDLGRHVLRKSDAVNKFENKNRPVQG